MNNYYKNYQMTDIKYIDLCCGIGSFHYSFKKLGWKCIMACDINKSARINYKNNYNLDPLEDIYKIDPSDIEPFDILCAGIPCQPFSQSGNQLGFKDSRGLLFFEVVKFLKFHHPKIIIIENVQGLLKHDKGNTLKRIISELEKEKYKVVYKVLVCSDYGIPQMRKRIFIIGIREDISIHNVDSIFDLKKYEKKMTLTTYLHKNFEKEVAYTIRCGGKNSPINDKHNWDGYYVDKKEYRLTIHDALKLQGFDTDFTLVGTEKEKWTLLGNTIPTIFTEIIGKNIIKFYN